MEMPPSPTALPPVRVVAVVPHWNRRDLLATLLDNLTLQTRHFDEVIVVDNGSSDDSVRFAREKGARVVAFDRNLGFAAAVNRGIAAALDAPQPPAWIAILNNDVTLATNWLAELLAAAETQLSDSAFLTGKILSAANPALLDGTFDLLSRAACAARCGAGLPDAPLWNQPRIIRFASMTAVLFRASVFRSLGTLDETFGSYMEDVEFGLRCALAGCHGSYIPTAVAYHQGSATFGQWSAQSVFRISRNQLLLAAKHFALQPRLPLIVGQGLWGLLALRHGCGRAFLGGKLAGWRDRRQLTRPDKTDSAALRALLEKSEEEILNLGRETHLDQYWRAYFWLSPR
jgi:GT2 family glycosyltransferase